MKDDPGHGDAMLRQFCASELALSREMGGIEPADIGQLVVDDDDLLVVRVQRALVRVEEAFDPSSAG
jgi:hypothetical protein